MSGYDVDRIVLTFMELRDVFYTVRLHLRAGRILNPKIKGTVRETDSSFFGIERVTENASEMTSE